jgi:hypothetical protein
MYGRKPEERWLTSKIKDPIGMTVPRQDDIVADFVLVKMVENTRAIRAVAVPRILEDNRLCGHDRGKRTRAY